MVSVLATVAVFATWCVAPARLAHRAMEDSTREEFPALFGYIVQARTLVRWAGGSPRALDRWLWENRQKLFERAFVPGPEETTVEVVRRPQRTWGAGRGRRRGGGGRDR